MITPRVVAALAGATLAMGSPASAHATAPDRAKLHLFAPGIISGPANDAAASFMPDGRTVYFFRSNGQDYDIMVSHRVGAHWSRPRIAPFSGRWRDLEPAVSPDGRYLVFASSRPVDGSSRPIDGHWGGHLHAGRGGNLWRVDRRGNGWSHPLRLPATVNRVDATFSPAIARDGTLYFMAAGEGHEHFRLYRATFAHGTYAAPQPLPFSSGRWSDMDPAVAPDRSFIVFASTRPPTPAHSAEVFIAFRNGNRWSRPVPLGPSVNGIAPIDELRLGPDGHTLYLTSGHVVPPDYPKTSGTAATGLQRMRDWNDGNDNIWRIDLAPMLPALRARAGHSAAE